MEDAHKEIEKLETARHQAMAAGDADTLKLIIAPDALYVHSNAITETGATYVDLVAKGKYRYRSVSQPEMEIKTLGDIVIVTGRTIFHLLLPDNSERILNGRTVVIWVKNKGGWVAKHIQGTPIIE